MSKLIDTSGTNEGDRGGAGVSLRTGTWAILVARTSDEEADFHHPDR
ncbi:hypothetical protein [Saccharothrix saharensis]|nr:hypothetical protein [Saccharothrix saharensis]